MPGCDFTRRDLLRWTAVALASPLVVRGDFLGGVAAATTRGDDVSPANLELVTLTEDTAIITWYTGYTGSDDGLGRMKPAPADGEVRWGTDPKRLKRVTGGSRHDTPYHYVELTDLEPGQTYYYQAWSNGKAAPPTQFTLISGNAVGTSDFGLATGGPYNTSSTVTTVDGRDAVPALSDRSIGWLRYLHRKATTPDDWSREGHPHPHWDDRSDAPMASWHRFDLVDSSYAVGLMARTTPAWREVYVQILDELIARHTGWWSARDWLTQFGPDPRRGSYPAEYQLLIPSELWGDYDAPGWTANGIEPWPVQMDPIAADGMLFYKGFFLVLLGIRSLIARDDRWNEPFAMIRDGEHTFTWSHSGIAAHLADQWRAMPKGVHCENTKIWPY